jgi:hypothetical protein
MDFIASTVEDSEPGAEAELEVWERLKETFSGEDYGVAYHKYPVIDKGGGIDSTTNPTLSFSTASTGW